AARHRVDEDRVYVTGLSMGGFGTWALAAAYPDRFAAIAPICGGGDPEQACRHADVPTWAFHGEQDQVVPVERTEEMVEALQACNGDVRMTLYPDLGHDSWTVTYDNPELYEWMLKQRR
ncbi:MAG: prolyl oligopeptidase family serine peptidase, partial [Coriobacteriia bacterium]|nr:prolyl oligopeptidase family serine peptidase [Coriobacteriia bacterium]